MHEELVMRLVFLIKMLLKLLKNGQLTNTLCPRLREEK